jgi:hypothetical protein
MQVGSRYLHFYHFGRRALATHGFSSFPRDAPADPLYDLHACKLVSADPAPALQYTGERLTKAG